jgi:hypothetical protein
MLVAAHDSVGREHSPQTPAAGSRSPSSTVPHSLQKVVMTTIIMQTTMVTTIVMPTTTVITIVMPTTVRGYPGVCR